MNFVFMRRHEISDKLWEQIKPLLPKRGRSYDDRLFVNAVLFHAKTGLPWRDLPERYGPYTTAYNRFNRWRKAAVWDRMMDAITQAHDGEVQMIDTSIVRVHQHAAGAKKGVAFVIWAEAAEG